MSETVTNVPCFEQSVSFGRFEHDSLCWERWSTFPTNKYLEEVEKCSTPGSVAQKKAYFEAHYKNVAARRAELLLDQERERAAELVNIDNSASRILVYSSSEKDVDNEKADMEISARKIDQWENRVGSFDGEAIVEHVPELPGTIDSAGVVSQENELSDLSNDMSGHIDGALTVNDSASEKEIDNKKAGIVSSVNVIDQWENQVGSFDGQVIVELVPVKNDSADDFNDENKVSSNNGEVSVEHVHVGNDTGVVISQENEVTDFSSDLSAHIDGALTVNYVNELENLTSEKCEEDFVDFKDGDNIIREVVKTEVAKDIGELNDGAVVVDEVVKRQMIVHIDEPNDEAGIIEESSRQDQQEIASESSCPMLKIPVIGQLKEPVSATEDMPSVSEGLPEEKVNRTITEDKSKSLIKLAGPKKMQQATSVQRNTSTTYAKNKPASSVPKRTSVPMPRSSMLSTSKPLKPDLTKVAKSSNRLLDKKEKGVTPLTSKKTIGPQSKRLVPTSLHMSLSLGPTNSDPASLTRRSLIMESMSDKDIVKRAFKAF